MRTTVKFFLSYSPRALVFAVGVLVGLVFSGCETNPYTNRSQFLVLPESQMNDLGAQQYTQVLSDPKVTISKNPREVDPVKRVAARIIEAAKRSKYGDSAKTFDWDVNVIKDDKTKNAWALPGGKIAVYTGIFPMAKTEAGLAAIMGHEVVHALAQHGGERMSQGLAAQGLLTVGAVALSTQGLSPQMNQMAMQALGMGTQVGVLLPFSRSHESEADYIGLLLAADAGYDPREAVGIWQRMAQASQGAPAEFLSTHPAHETRIADLKKWMPEAMKIFNRARKAPVGKLPTITPPPAPKARPAPQKGSRFR